VEGLVLDALLAAPDGSDLVRGRAAGADPEDVAARCVEALRAAGAERVLAMRS
jgi:hypothetical protein